MADAGEPAELLLRYLPELRSSEGSVLDLACGAGRNAAPLAAAGARVIGIDRDREALCALARKRVLGVAADLERSGSIPLQSGSCRAVLVFRFLFRPLAREIERVLAPGGLLLYETFTVRQRELGYGPRNPAFLLETGELLALFARLQLLAYEEGLFGPGRVAATARLAARKLGA